MVSVYHVGVIQALEEQFGFSGFSRVIASSGAAATYSYLLSGQQELIRPIWEDLLISGKFIRPIRKANGKNVIDIDFLVDQEIKQKFPLNLSALKNSPIDLEVGVTNATTAESKYFSKNDPVDFYELLRASCAIPYFYGKKVKLNGEYYYDGTIGSVSGLERVSNESNIIVILTRPPKPLPEAVFFRKILKWLLLRKEAKILQDTIWDMPRRYLQISAVIKKLKITKNVVVVQPQKSLPIFRIDNRLKSLQKTIDQGYSDVLRNKELADFFNKIQR